MKYLLLLIYLIMFSLTAKTITIAQVGKYTITEEQLESKIKEYDDKYNYSKTQKCALNDLIEDYLLLIYAEQNGINVTDKEVESFMISQLSDHPSLQTEGFFDFDKYLKLINSEKGNKLTAEIKKDLLINKSRFIIESSFDVTDEFLLELFIMENVKIDINYALLNVNDIAVPEDRTVEKAYNFYQKNKQKIFGEPEINVRFMIIESKDFKDSALVLVQEKVHKISLINSDLSETEKVNIITHYTNIFADSLAEAYANNIIKRNRNFTDDMDLSLKPTFWETGFVANSEELGKIFQVEKIIERAFDLPVNQIQKIKRGKKIVLFTLYEQQEPQPYLLECDKNQIWQAYLKSEITTQSTLNKQQYFWKHFDEFIVPVAVVTKIQIPKRSEQYKDQIKEQISQHVYNDSILKDIIRSHKLKSSNNVIYLKRYRNKSDIDNQIAALIKNEQDYGFIKIGKREIFYKHTTFFPEFIPDYSIIDDQILRENIAAEDDTTGFKEYYEEYKDRFVTADSLRLGGVYIKINTDTLKIEPEEIKNYYEKNKNDFIRKKSVKFDYIYTENKNVLKQITKLLSTADFSKIKLAYSQDIDLPTQKIIEYDSLPDLIKSTLAKINNNEISIPFKFQNGFLFIKKIAGYRAGLNNFAKVKPEIEEELKREIADKIAYNTAKTVYDSCRYFSDCYRFAQNEAIFKTKRQEIDLEFDIVGFLPDKNEFLRMWNNEKYNSIIKLDEGYAVVFLLNKIPSKKIDYEHAVPMLSGIFKEKSKFDIAKKYANSLRAELQNGCDADSLFYFFGGWRELPSLSLNSIIPEIHYSKIILEDMAKRDEGYLSPLIKISEEQLFFYQITKKNKIPLNKFRQNKEIYKNKIIEEKFHDWLNNYRSTVNIQIYQR